MGILIGYIVITLSFIGYFYFTYKIFKENCKKPKILPVYVIPEPVYENNKEIVTFVKGYTYKIKYPITVI